MEIQKKKIRRITLRVNTEKANRSYDSSSPYIHDGSEIDENILFEILIRLPLGSIIRFRSVSKLWLSILSENSFLTTKLSRKWALFSNLQYPIQLPDLLTTNIMRCEFDSELLGKHDGFSLRFLYPDKCPQYGYIYVLASSNGALLCSITNYNQKSYILCNPLTKTKILVPQVPNDISRGSLKHGFICESYSCLILTPTVYKIVSVPWMLKPTSQITKFNIDIFSSDLGHWNRYEVTVPEKIRWRSDGNIIIHNGVAYWIIDGNRIIAYDLNDKSGTHQCRLIALPDTNFVDGSYGCLGVSEGSVVYVPSKQGQLNVWILEEKKNTCSGGSRWISNHALLPNGLPRRLQTDDVLKAVAINPKDQNELILDLRESCHGRIYYYYYYYNIKTRLLRQLSFWRNQTSTLVLLITPWPSTLR